MSEHHETQDASIRVVLACGACLVALIGAGIGLATLLHAGSFQKLPEVATFDFGPKYRTDIERAWPALDRQFREHLETYGWVDRRKGTVRIPIERAMKLLVERQGGKPSP